MRRRREEGSGVGEWVGEVRVKGVGGGVGEVR